MSYGYDVAFTQVMSLVGSLDKLDNRGREKKEEKHPYFKRPGRCHNRDTCDACGGGGQIICCDTCSASFHLICHDPPMEIDDLPSGGWRCQRCKYKDWDNKVKKNKKFDPKPLMTPAARRVEIRREERIKYMREAALRKKRRQQGIVEKEDEEFKPPNPIKAFFDEVLVQCRAKNPVQFSLPSEYGVNIPLEIPGRAKPAKKNQSGKSNSNQKPFCIENENGILSRPTVTCFFCSKSARREPMIKCDLCDLYFHLHCLDPPMTIIPSSKIVWACALHPAHFMEQKLLRSPALSQRKLIWDKFKKPVDPVTVKLNFINLCKKNRPFIRKVPIDPPVRLKIVPSFLRYTYDKAKVIRHHASTEEVVKPIKGFENLYDIESPKTNEKPNDTNDDNITVLNAIETQSKMEDKECDSLLVLANTAMFLEKDEVELDFVSKMIDGMDEKTIKKLAMQKLCEMSREQRDEFVRYGKGYVNNGSGSSHSHSQGSSQRNDNELTQINEFTKVIYQSQLKEDNDREISKLPNGPKSPKSILPQITFVCINSRKKITFSGRTLKFGKGQNVNCDLSKYVDCSCIGELHAVVTYNSTDLQWELLNYSAYGTKVNSVIYGCEGGYKNRKASNWAGLTEKEKSIQAFKEMIDEKRKTYHSYQNYFTENDLLNLNGASCKCDPNIIPPIGAVYEGCAILRKDCRIQMGCAVLFIEALTQSEVDSVVVQMPKMQTPQSYYQSKKISVEKKHITQTQSQGFNLRSENEDNNNDRPRRLAVNKPILSAMAMTMTMRGGYRGRRGGRGGSSRGGVRISDRFQKKQNEQVQKRPQPQTTTASTSTSNNKSNSNSQKTGGGGGKKRGRKPKRKLSESEEEDHQNNNVNAVSKNKNVNDTQNRNKKIKSTPSTTTKKPTIVLTPAETVKRRKSKASIKQVEIEEEEEEEKEEVVKVEDKNELENDDQVQEKEDRNSDVEIIEDKQPFQVPTSRFFESPTSAVYNKYRNMKISYKKSSTFKSTPPSSSSELPITITQDEKLETNDEEVILSPIILPQKPSPRQIENVQVEEEEEADEKQPCDDQDQEDGQDQQQQGIEEVQVEDDQDQNMEEVEVENEHDQSIEEIQIEDDQDQDQTEDDDQTIDDDDRTIGEITTEDDDEEMEINHVVERKANNYVLATSVPVSDLSSVIECNTSYLSSNDNDASYNNENEDETLDDEQMFDEELYLAASTEDEDDDGDEDGDGDEEKSLLDNVTPIEIEIIHHNHIQGQDEEEVEIIHHHNHNDQNQGELILSNVDTNDNDGTTDEDSGEVKVGKIIINEKMTSSSSEDKNGVESDPEPETTNDTNTTSINNSFYVK